MKKGFVYLMVLFTLFLGACSPTVVSSTPVVPTTPVVSTVGIVNTVVVATTVPATATQTLVPPTATTLPTNTSTPLPTVTPFPTATATPAILAINIDLTLDVSKLPVITMDDITSGKLTQTELSLYNSGAVKKISDKAVAMKMDSVIVQKYSSGTISMHLKENSSDYSDFSYNPEKRSYQPVSLNVVVIDGKKLLIYGEAYLNADGSVGILHYGYQDWSDPFYMTQIKRTMSGEFFPLPYATMTKGYSLGTWVKAGNEPVMMSLYEKDSELRGALINEWATTGNIPAGLSKILLIPFMDPMYLPH